MIILAIETSTDACSVALSINTEILERYEQIPRAHARLLLPMVDSLLKEAQVALTEIDILACGRGPGSFTGLRIETAVVQGLSVGVGKPVVLVSTLSALAQGRYRTAGTTHVFATLDARMQAIYWGLFAVDSNGIMQPMSEEKVQNPTEIVLPEGPWVEVSGFPSARDILPLAHAEYVLGHTVAPQHIQPIYLRNEVVQQQ